MSSKMKSDHSFYFNLFCVANYFFHHPTNNHHTLNQKLKKLADMIKIKMEDTEYCYNFLKENNILYEMNHYYFINFDLLKKYISPLKNNHSSIMVQTNFEILVKPEINLETFWLIIQIAELKQKDIVYKFIITENSLHNALAHTMSVKQIKLFLSQAHPKRQIPQNIQFFLDEINHRMGEIKISQASGFLMTKSHILKTLMHDEHLKKMLVKTFSPTLGLIQDHMDIWALYYYLKSKKYYPLMEIEKIQSLDENKNKIYLTNQELEYLLTTYYTLHDIGYEHKLKVNINQLNSLIHQIEKNLSKELVFNAKKLSTEYQQQLKTSIKNYIIKSMKINMVKPDDLVINQVSEQYQGENPATTRKEMIKIIDYALKNKLKLLVSYYLINKKKVEKIIELRYLYDNRLLYYYDKDTRKQETIALDRIIFLLLI